MTRSFLVILAFCCEYFCFNSNQAWRKMEFSQPRLSSFLPAFDPRPESSLSGAADEYSETAPRTILWPGNCWPCTLPVVLWNITVLCLLDGTWGSL
jgi:hypothetical protein